MVDPGFVAPAEEVDDFARAAAMTVVDITQSDGSGPSSIAIDHDTDVPGQLGARELMLQSSLVQPVRQIGPTHDSAGYDAALGFGVGALAEKPTLT